MSNLKNQLIKLGAENKELRKHIRPVLAELKKKADFNPYTVKYEPRLDAFVITLGRGAGAGAQIKLYLDVEANARLSDGHNLTIDLSKVNY